MLVFGFPALVLILLAILFPRAMRLLFMAAVVCALFTGIYFYQGYERWAAQQPWSVAPVAARSPAPIPDVRLRPINPDTATPAELDWAIDNAR